MHVNGNVNVVRGRNACRAVSTTGTIMRALGLFIPGGIKIMHRCVGPPH